ncbi:PP2C family protein-serine/threonine phosphatase [Rhodohalobacter barkolensis]|uniref:Serine/threonine-protein phosphatase n=1 Tax=Rhodohalobacter barkolensis TaxID=2053187 RepID=A0A2N0VLI1_9BACT|nr:PP2C family protein-serine/threonine phosphatase [Rhodohalobacter barkolensis]PKD45057.1 serine/threonine-protein phosphatase [Rhodohalobacter barkolensis]
MGLKNETKSKYDTKTFYKEYVSGMNSRQLGKEFQSDSERLKKLYFDALKETNPNSAPQKIPITQKFLSLLSALTKRLNPVRRLVFGISVVSFFLHFILSFIGLTIYPIQPLLLPVAFLGMLAILLIELLEKSDVQKELDFARDIQLSLLPPSATEWQQHEAYSFAATASEVGGDYVDIIKTEKGTYVIIADVSGKGISAALYMVRMQALVHLLIKKLNPGPKELFLELNEYVKSNKMDKTFVTACAAFFPNGEDHFIFARAGHNTPIIFNKKLDSTFSLKTEGFALGMTSTRMLRKNLEEKKFQFEAGDSILFYTDGLVEARNRHNEEYGEERLDGLMSIYGSLHAKSITQKIQSSIELFAGDEKPMDDITFTTVHKNDPPKQIDK